VEYIRLRNPDHLWRHDRGGDYGDWLNGDMTNLPEYPRGVSAMPTEAFATAFYAHSTQQNASSTEFVGHLRFGKFPKGMVERDFGHV